MDFSPTLLSLSRAIAYKVNSLTERYLQEAGSSPLSTYALHRYALIPAIIWSLIFIRADDITYILGSGVLLGYLLFIAVVWNVQQFLHSYIVNTTSSVSALSNLYQILVLPLLLLVGAFFNHDTPNIFSVIAISLLVLALLIKPAHHKNNHRVRFSKPFILIASLILIQAIVDAVIIGMYREVLKEVSPEVVIGLFSIAVLIVCVFCVSFFSRRQKNEQVEVVQKFRWRALSIPMLWFAGTIPEMYAYTALPIYIVLAIGAITFVMDVFSDLRRHRISFNLQTVSFIGLVFSGISLAIYSVY